MQTTNNNSSTLHEIFGEPISTYTGQQAIEDGFLVDVSETAKEAGFNWPVAVTPELWADIQAIPSSKSWQDVSGRLWDVVFMLVMAIKLNKRADLQVIHYNIIMHVGMKTNYFLTAEMTMYNTEGQPMLVIKKRTA